jgi:hypothetical protein
MASDLEQLELIRTQTLALIADMTAAPKPSYNIDGQSISWTDYLEQLQKTVDWCERKTVGEDPFEIQSQGIT